MCWTNKSTGDKELVIKNRSKLKNSGIFLNDDLSVMSTRQKSSLLPVLKELKRVNPRAHIRGDKIFSNGRLYDEKNIHELPIDAHKACTPSKDTVTIFSGKFSKLSNLHPCELILEGKSWHSVEQFYQFKKASIAGAHAAAAQILTTDDATEAMYLGKSVIPPQAEWKEMAKDILNEALSAKFSKPVFKLALKTAGPVIGESTYHSTYGTGFAPSHTQAFNPPAWTGENVMGKLLMDLKKKLCK